MPGTIHVSVLEVVGLPARDTTGSREFVSVKVSLGEQEFVTNHKRLNKGKTAPWNSDFIFPVLYLTDRLVVAVCDPAGEIKSSIAIDVPPILEAGYKDEFVGLDKGGHIHLKLSFVLTNEERKRLIFMRAAADRREFQENKDDMLRLYNFRREEGHCVNNGLRTVAESNHEHAGKALDHWEVFSKKKGKKVSSAKLFALPLPQPAGSLNPKLGPTVEAGKPDEIEHHTDNQNRSNHRCPSGSPSPGDNHRCPSGSLSPGDDTQKSDSDTFPIKGNNDETVLESFSFAKFDRKGDDRSKDGDIIDNEMEVYQPHSLISVDIEYNSSAPLNVVGDLEQLTVHSSSGNDVSRQAKHGDVVCDPPEMEECMQMPGHIQDPMRNREGSPSPSKNPTLNVFIPKKMDVAAGQAHSGWENRRTTGCSTLKEKMTSAEEWPHADIVASIRGLESLQMLPTPNEVQKSSVKRSLNAIKDMSVPLARVRGKTPVPRAREDTQVPRVREEKLRSLPPALSRNIVEQGLHQQRNNSGSSSFHDQGVSRLSNAWVRVGANSSLMSEELQNSSTTNETGSKPVAPVTPAPMDGWICVEHPPMTWEDALKVAQKARETAVGTNYPSTPRLSPSLLASPPLPNFAAPVSPQTPGKTNTFSQIQPGQGAVFSPLPLPPKQSQNKGKISQGNVKAQINAFESKLHQGPNLSVSKPEIEKMQLEPSPAWMAVEVQKKSRTPENTVIDKGQSAQESACLEEWRLANQNPEKGSPQVDLPEESMGKDQEAKLPENRLLHRLDPPAAEERLGVEETGKLTMQGQSEDRTCTAQERVGLEVTGNLTMHGESRGTPLLWRLPVLKDINMEAMQDRLTQGSFVEEGFVSAVDGRSSPLCKEERGNFQDQWNCQFINKRPGMEELEGMDEKEVVAENPLSLMDKTVLKTKDCTSLGSHFNPENHADNQDSDIKLRCSQNSLMSNRTGPSTLQKLALCGDSLQAWKSFQNSITTPRKSFSISGSLNNEFQQINTSGERITFKGMEEPFAATAQQALSKADNIFKENSSTLLDHLQSPPVCKDPSEKTFQKSGDLSKDRDSIFSHLGGVVKQVLGGAVILAGLFALWPRNFGRVERYHVVKAGETLSSIAPGQCNDPSSHFCTINPRICDQKTIYPGQRLRLS